MQNKAIQQALFEQYRQVASLSIAEMLRTDPYRARDFMISTDNLYIDYSKSLCHRDTLEVLLRFAQSRQVSEKIAELFSGKKINFTEARPALHTALRCSGESGVMLAGHPVSEWIHNERNKIKRLVEDLHGNKLQGGHGRCIKTVVNIGIGGSDLGPRLVVDAMQKNGIKKYDVRFISNIDPLPLENMLAGLDLARTLFIVSSKSFTTLETLQNAEKIKAKLLSAGHHIANHFVAITAKPEKAMAFGIEEGRVFKTWEWISGRFSLWSATGLPIAIALGYDNFSALLAGAERMDRHFREAPLHSNAPVILALLDYWYGDLFGRQSHAFIPYDDSLSLLPPYLAQLMMESNGKGVNLRGERISQQTSPVVWGAVGTDAQHSIAQLLHQAPEFIPVDFLLPLRQRGDHWHHKLLFANCIAQARSLMLGDTDSDPHKVFPGNRPSTIILYKSLTPFALGELLALFEHRVFVQGVLWEINPFDQWGVELGKKIATLVVDALDDKTSSAWADASTGQLLQLYQAINQ